MTEAVTQAVTGDRVSSTTLLERIAGPGATLREDQATAIDALAVDQRRVLLVQRTGWGKSAVYWIATRHRRDQGAGPTLVVSPLLALMRDQVAAAQRLGLEAAMLNSANVDEWNEIEAALDADEIDVLLISPERLDAPSFRARAAALAPRLGLLVVDEAHCISDWGHDFRPDYRRIGELLPKLTPGTPVLACTATANARVTTDVAAQLGDDVLTLRGELGRASLKLAVVHLPDAPTRLAWLTAYIRGQHEATGRAGVVYALTVADTERVAALLSDQGLAVAAYSSAVEPDQRRHIEDQLRDNELAAVVATSSLGMGYDKRDLGFVVHLGAPSSPVAYYQQIGRAGRALDAAEVVLLPTAKDAAIWHHFDLAGIPTASENQQVLEALDETTPISVPALERLVNLRRSRLELLLRVLAVEGAVERGQGGWRATGQPWEHDDRRYEALAELRRAEHAAMRRLVTPGFDGCLMRFLTEQLDDPEAEDCGRCAGCTGWQPDVEVDPDLVADLRAELRGRDNLVRPRRRWPTGLDEVRGNIAPSRQPQVGRSLAAGDESGWDDVVDVLLAPGGEEPGAGAVEAAFTAAVDGLVGVLARWDWATRPTSVVPIPSRTHPQLIDRLAERIGSLGRLPVISAVVRTTSTPPQADMANSTYRAANALAAYDIDPAAAAKLPDGPVLLLDVATDSGWTLTAVTWRLRAVHDGEVLPLVLQSRG